MDEHNNMFAPFLNKSGILTELVTLNGADHYRFRLDKPTELDGQRLESYLVSHSDLKRLSTKYVYLILVLVPRTWLIAMGYTGNNCDNGIHAYMELEGRQQIG